MSTAAADSESSLTALDEHVAGDAVAAPVVNYQLRVRTLVSLAAGRGSFRLAQLAATVILLPLWGQTRYGVYAAAVTTFTWIIPLLQSGPEKTVLKLLPRAPRTGPPIVEALTGLLWCLIIAMPLTFGITLALGQRHTAAVYVGVSATAVGSGSTLLLAGLHRVTGRPWFDARSAFALSAVQVALIALAAAGLGPLGYVIGMVAGQTLVNAVLLTHLPRPSLRIRARRGFARRVVWTIVLMGGPEVCLYMTTSVLFAIIAATRWSGEVAQLFAVSIVWTAGLTLLIYTLRVYAPMASLRLLGRGGVTGRARASRLARWALIVDVLWIVAFAGVASQVNLTAVAVSDHAFILWAAISGSRTPAIVLTVLAGYLLENSDARSTRVTGTVAVANLLVASAIGAYAIPRWGGLWIGLSVLGAEMVGAVILIAMVRHGRRIAAPLSTSAN